MFVDFGLELINLNGVKAITLGDDIDDTFIVCIYGSERNITDFAKYGDSGIARRSVFYKADFGRRENAESAYDAICVALKENQNYINVSKYLDV